ncbi:MAG: hypothetical protein U0169_14990 [Polyangiaceae bacterium]
MHPPRPAISPRTVVAFAAFLASSARVREASAQNSDPFFYSSEAALSGGAVTATTRDAGAIWYNPAGLGGLRHDQVDVSATTFGIRIRSMNDVLRTPVGGGVKGVDLRSADILSVPNAIGVVRRFTPRLSIGAGLFVNDRDVRATEDTSTIGLGPGEAFAPGTFRQRVDLSTDRNGYRFGPSLGYEVSPTFRFGVSVFGTYRTVSQFSQYSFDVASDDPSKEIDPSFVILQSRSTTTAFGLTFQGGIQWIPSRGVHVGAVVRAPEFFLGSSDRGADVLASGNVDARARSVFELTQPRTTDNAFSVVAPMRVVGSIAAEVGARSWVAAEVDFQAGLSSSVAERQPMVNARLGGVFALSEEWKVGVGIFSDRAPIRTLVSSFGERVDYYGISGGIEKRTPLSIGSNPRPDALVLTTTLALRYAMGFANVRAVDLGDGAPPRTITALYHDILPFFGSAVLF